jgi:hypothetical protein
MALTWDARLAESFEPHHVFRKRPRRVTDELDRLCHEINPAARPIDVPVRPRPGARLHMCFSNVKSACAEHGGTMLCGWLIWEWAKTFIEAEHHAVWQRDRDLIDITPNLASCPTVMFLPDPGRSFDFEDRRRRDNKRVALRRDTSVREYLCLARQYVALEEAHSICGEVVFDPQTAARARSITLRLKALEGELASWSVKNWGRNEPCWCNGGLKHKCCCLARRALSSHR